MFDTRPSLSIGLDEERCQAVVDGALRLLDETGMECASAAGRDFMAANPGVRVKGDRVHFDRDFLTDYLASVRDTARGGSDQPFRLGPPWISLNIADARSGQVRGGTEADLARAVRLYEAMDIRNGMPPVTVASAPPEHQGLFNTMVCLENSESFGHPTETPAEDKLAPFLDMFAVAGRKPRVLALFIISPLRYESRLIEFCLRHRDDPRLEIAYGASGMPCVGSTAPLSFPAAFCQALAEGLAGAVFASFCTGRRSDFSMRVDPFDFRFANYVVGSVEAVLLNAATRRLFAHLFGRPWRDGRLLTMARWPDAQAVHDHTMAAYLQAAQGARTFRGCGQISHDEVFSPEIVVIDREIVASAERFVRGLRWDDGPQAVPNAVETVRAGLPAGNYLEHDATLEGFREFQFSGELFKGMNLAQWRQAGGRPLLAEASAQVDELVAGNGFRRPEEQVRELRAIYRRATAG